MSGAKGIPLYPGSLVAHGSCVLSWWGGYVLFVIVTIILPVLILQEIIVEKNNA
jgi:hypothetical protein